MRSEIQKNLLSNCLIKRNNVLNHSNETEEIKSENKIKVNASITTGTGQQKLVFGWTAFKWATGSDIDEEQEVECTIGLSQSDPEWTTTQCP